MSGQTATPDARLGTDLRSLLGPGVAVQVRSDADLGRSHLDRLIALVAVQRDVLARAAAHIVQVGTASALPEVPDVR